MIEIRLTPAAQRDLDRIWEYSETNWGAQKAQEYVESIRATLVAARAEQRVRKFVSSRNGYFKSNAGKHVIYYKITDTHLDVVRILHGRMDPERHL